jgi:hypothetical protein
LKTFTDIILLLLTKAFFVAHPHFAQRFPGGILQFAQMAGQLPPDVLEDLMLVEAVNAPDGVIPGGLDNVRDDDEENVVEVNFDQREGPLPPLGATALENEVEDGHDQLEDENEEEDISVSQTTFKIPYSENVILTF